MTGIPPVPTTPVSNELDMDLNIVTTQTDVKTALRGTDYLTCDTDKSTCDDSNAC